VSVTVKAPQAGQQLHPTIITSEGFAVVRDTEQEVTYPHPFFALPSSEGGLVEVVVDEVVVDVELVDEVDDGAGCTASVITPKSLPWEVPNETVVEESGLEVISYCA
jgi:hypothetical protein